MDGVRNCFLELSIVSTLISWTTAIPVRAANLHADPSNYEALLRSLKPGDTLSLAPGRYRALNLSNLNGTPEDWITVTGPSEGSPAMIEGEPERNTVEITDSSYLSIENLVINSRSIPGVFGISARGKENNRTHHIRIERNTLIGQNGGQQTDGISTKTPTWGWVIRYNKIIGAGTGLYLGDSDGTQPFVGGLIENNLIKDTIGYNMEIKHQLSIPAVPGMPLGPTSTIIRHNVFIKNDQRSEDGDRPNLLVGSFPDTGAGSDNLYEIYGNYFVHNHREALFQGSGRLSLHDNVFIDGPYDYPAVVLRKQNGPLKVAMIYNNTIYTSDEGIRFGSPAINGGMVVGNIIFAPKGISGTGVLVSDNLTASVEAAPAYVRAPSFDPSEADFYPLSGRCQGAPIDLSTFQSDADYTLDFNGRAKTQVRGAVVFRGAYSGEGQNPGWKLDATLKAPVPPVPNKPRVVWVVAGSAGKHARLTVIGANFAEGATVDVSGNGIEVSDTVVESPTELHAALKIAPGIAVGSREITVTTSAGTSNAFKSRLDGEHRAR
jgi:hypothetical protein